MTVIVFAQKCQYSLSTMRKIVGPRGQGLNISRLVNKLFCLKEYEKVVKLKMIDNVARKNMVLNNFTLFKIYTK